MYLLCVEEDVNFGQRDGLVHSPNKNNKSHSSLESYGGVFFPCGMGGLPEALACCGWQEATMLKKRSHLSMGDNVF